MHSASGTNRDVSGEALLVGLVGEAQAGLGQVVQVALGEELVQADRALVAGLAEPGHGHGSPQDTPQHGRKHRCLLASQTL